MEDKTPFDDDITMDINADADIPGNTHLSNAETDSSPEAEKLAIDLQEQKDKYLRLVAEFDNYKRRTAKEKIELAQTAGKEIIAVLLEILDDAERAEKQLQVSDNIKAAKEGITLVFNKLRNILQQKGLSPMQSINTDLDVEKHEAIAETDVDKSKKGKVIDEVQKGYYLNDKILRFAKVIVGK
jgi:molecular chaperone GrpE